MQSWQNVEGKHQGSHYHKESTVLLLVQSPKRKPYQVLQWSISKTLALYSGFVTFFLSFSQPISVIFFLLD